MGRSPCCDKIGLKKGPWTPEEDHKLLAYIEQHGHGSWRALPVKAGLERCGKSCRLRWSNYLRPDIKRGKFSLQEEQTIIQLHALLGNRWSAIATHLPKRTDNEIKNYWNTHLKKRLTKMGIDPLTHKPKNETLLRNDGHSKHVANLSHMAQWESARLEAEARLVRHSKLRSTTNFQNNHFGSPSSTSTSNNPGPAWGLDVLKSAFGGGAASITPMKGHLESPKSTLSYSENATQVSKATGVHGESSINVFTELGGNSSGCCEVGILKEEDEEDEEDWKRLGSSSTYLQGHDRDAFENSKSNESAWTTQEALGPNPEHIPTENFMEKFSDILLGGSGDRSFSDGDDSGGSNGCGGGDSEYCEDNKNYWNSIFNLVNSSPDSPVF